MELTAAQAQRVVDDIAADETAFAFTASIVKVQTLADQGLRVTLDLSEDEIAAAAKLMECKRFGATVHVIMEPEHGAEHAPARIVQRDPRARGAEKLK